MKTKKNNKIQIECCSTIFGDSTEKSGPFFANELCWYPHLALRRYRSFQCFELFYCIVVIQTT